MRFKLPFAKDITIGDFNTICYNGLWPNALKLEFSKCPNALWLKMVANPSQFIFPDDGSPLMHTVEG